MSIPIAFARSGWLFLAALAACAPARTPPLSAPPAELGRIVPGRVTNHVIIISLDGMRPDAITRFRPRTLRRLIAEGSHSPEAQTTLPSRTLPSHMSMMSGKKPEAHGVINNEDPDETRWMTDVPTVMAVAHDRGLQTIALFSKTKFRQIYEPDALDYADQPGGWLGLRMAGKTRPQPRSGCWESQFRSAGWAAPWKRPSYLPESGRALTRPGLEGAGRRGHAASRSSGA